MKAILRWGIGLSCLFLAGSVSDGYVWVSPATRCPLGHAPDMFSVCPQYYWGWDGHIYGPYYNLRPPFPPQPTFLPGKVGHAIQSGFLPPELLKSKDAMDLGKMPLLVKGKASKDKEKGGAPTPPGAGAMPSPHDGPSQGGNDLFAAFTNAMGNGSGAGPGAPPAAGPHPGAYAQVPYFGHGTIPQQPPYGAGPPLAMTPYPGPMPPNGNVPYPVPYPVNGPAMRAPVGTPMMYPPVPYPGMGPGMGIAPPPGMYPMPQPYPTQMAPPMMYPRPVPMPPANNRQASYALPIPVTGYERMGPILRMQNVGAAPNPMPNGASPYYPYGYPAVQGIPPMGGLPPMRGIPPMAGAIPPMGGMPGTAGMAGMQPLNTFPPYPGMSPLHRFVYMQAPQSPGYNIAPMAPLAPMQTPRMDMGEPLPTRPAPGIYPTHPFTRSPRDFFMWGDNMDEERARGNRPYPVP